MSKQFIMWNSLNTVVIGVDATAKDWQLYTSSMTVKEQMEAEAALNGAFVTYINAYPLNIDMVRSGMRAFMDTPKCRAAGASDSEPDAFLCRLLSEVYGHEINRFD